MTLPGAPAHDCTQRGQTAHRRMHRLAGGLVLGWLALGWLALGSLGLAQPGEPVAPPPAAHSTAQDGAQALATAEAEQRGAAREADRLELEILKRQQQLLTAQRQGGKVAQAQSELEMTQDKHRLARAKLEVAELQLALLRANQEQTVLRAEKASAPTESQPEADREALRLRLATMESRLSALDLQLARLSQQLAGAQAEVARLSSALQARWGDRLAPPSSRRTTIYRAAPGTEALQPEEATEL
jgi:uncharacterized coiled-coil protein SlyX